VASDNAFDMKYYSRSSSATQLYHIASLYFDMNFIIT